MDQATVVKVTDSYGNLEGSISFKKNEVFFHDEHDKIIGKLNAINQPVAADGSRLPSSVEHKISNLKRGWRGRI